MASERYVRIWDAEQGKAVRAHRMIAEQTLGRSLEPGEVVHHINGDRSDNRPENLRVLPSQGHHMALEQLQRKVGRGIAPLFSAEELLK
jgi:HNH endonuclease